MNRDWATGDHEEVLIWVYETEIGQSLNDSLHRNSRFESCQMRAQAKMDAETKSEMSRCLSRDVEPRGIGEAARISVRGHEERQDELSGRDLDATNFCVLSR